MFFDTITYKPDSVALLVHLQNKLTNQMCIPNGYYDDDRYNNDQNVARQCVQQQHRVCKHDYIYEYRKLKLITTIKSTT